MNQSFKFLTILLVFAMLFSCSPHWQVHEYFEANRKVPDYSLHLYNDSLKIHFRSPADVDFYADAGEVSQRIEGEPWLKDIPPLMYGRTNTPPYEVFLFASQEPVTLNAPGYIQMDTLLNGWNYYFLGRALEPRAEKAVKSDMANMFHSLEAGEGYNREIPSLNKLVRRYMVSHRYLEALNVISNYPETDASINSYKTQMVLTYASFLGETTSYRGGRSEYESRFPVRPETQAVLKSSEYRNRAALEEIVQLASSARVVMVNENHFYPEHRITVRELLSPLRKLGYDYLALEALAPGQDMQLNRPGSFPTLETGFYTREQQFDRLIREAMQLGYTLVAYESEGENREAGQARNLYEKTIGKNPDGKVLVLAGVDHILESSNRMPRMAELFRDEYGIDPLTISQARLAHYPAGEDVRYVLARSDSLPGPEFTGVDYHLLNHQPLDYGLGGSPVRYTNTYDSKIQLALFYGNETDNPDELGTRVPYFTTMVEPGQTIIVPQATGQTSLRILYDGFGNELEWRAIPASAQ